MTGEVGGRSAVDVVVARIGEPITGSYHRVLIDRLWPRGVRKDQAPWDEWLRDVAPSTELRRWYGHDPSRRPEFERRYRVELRANAGAPALLRLADLARTRAVALLTATRDIERSQAPILAAFLREGLGGGPAAAEPTGRL